MRNTKRQLCLECQREWQKKSRKKDPAYFAEKDRKKNYGLDEAKYQQMLIDQAGCCAVCDDQLIGKVCVDHSHETGLIRGLLCNHCNLMLGHARDNIETLSRAIAYLTEISR